MDSPPDRDEGSRSLLLKLQAPFTQLRQYTDARIGSLLQDIIGLPSGSPSRHNSHGQCYSYDEKLKQKDELYAPRDASTNQTEIPIPNEVAIPVKKFPEWALNPDENRETSTPGKDIEDGIEKDLPLYSPVPNAIFSHLKQPSDLNVDWTKPDHSGNVNKDQFFFLPQTTSLSQLRNFQDTLNSRKIDFMKKIQLILYSELNKSCILHSQYSLLPYLSFSPYSPLKLSIDAKNDPRDADFPYCDAFQDLIESSFAQEKQLSRNFFDGHLADWSGIKRPGKSLQSSLHWIQELYHRGLLQQREIKSISNPLQKSQFIQYSLLNDYFYPQTELDIYDTLSNRSLPPVGERIKNSFLDGFFESIYDETENLWGKIMKNLNSEWNMDQVGSASLKNEKLEVTKPSLDPVQDLDRVVSSSTSTIQQFDQDGRISTSIEVRRIFADGRQTITTKFQKDGRCYDDKDQQHHIEEDKSNVVSQDVSSCLCQIPQTKDNKQQQKNQNSWFWK